MRGGSLLLHEDAVASGSSSVALDMDSLEMERMQDQVIYFTKSFIIKLTLYIKR